MTSRDKYNEQIYISAAIKGIKLHQIKSLDNRCFVCRLSLYRSVGKFTNRKTPEPSLKVPIGIGTDKRSCLNQTFSEAGNGFDDHQARLPPWDNEQILLLHNNLLNLPTTTKLKYGW